MLRRATSTIETVNGGVIVPVIAASRFLSLFSVGVGFVVMTWLGAVAGSMQLVGQLFLAGSITTLGISAITGVLSDQRSRISLIRWGWMVRFSGLSLFLAGLFEHELLVPGLFAFSITTALSNALGASAMDSAFQNAIPLARRVHLSMRLEIVRQAGLICGMGGGGFLLHAFGALTPSLLLLVTLGLQIVLFETSLSRYADGPVRYGQGGALRFWLDGVRSAFRDVNLAASILVGSLLVSVAQLTNLLVPVFVKDTLDGESDLYGLLESAWSAGGAALLTIVSLRHFLARERLEFLALTVIGILMIAFAMSRSVPLLILIYALLGGFFALGKALCDGRLLALARTEEIGRVRSASVMLNSAAGVLIFLSPTVFPNDNAVLYYCIWGGIVTVTGLVTFVFVRRQKVKTISP
ncbi:hypothetical protein GCM10011385_03290 [Nitratireductor aestuarii]|uniref:MFS transporter n=1 Tax=Nitratireductor aestuarii TaxID=1735103 RepID=A0A916RE30_9HYPH|nr:MFS transporter [Nitratireductor aestuarii]GGA53230.1 hypothetical protein GCM10011385_03290 [Nitratireductor aestuarii]